MAENTAPQPDGLPDFAARLAERMRREGPLTVADYMAAAAAHYYATQNVFGRTGDFTTAPEISQLFGEMIAAWLMDLWLRMGSPEPVQLIELGPGRGTLTADIMRTVKAWPQFRNAVTLHLVETSPRLRREQEKTLGDFQPVWYDRLEDVPHGFSFIIANEFFDALPIHQFQKIGGEWMERRVRFSERKKIFEFTHALPDSGLATMMSADFPTAPEGSMFEISPVTLTMIDQICGRLKRGGGAALVIDYGHDQPGLGDTLQALEQHGYADVLGNPGGRDITAHVDFGTCKLAADRQAVVHGPVTQGSFLTRLGIVARAESLAQDAIEEDARDVRGGLWRLTAPDQMGRLFKVMALMPKDSTVVPAGFADDTGGEEEHG